MSDVDAIEALERAGARLAPAKRARIYASLAPCYDRIGHTELAVASCRLALALEPDLVAPALLLATLLGENGSRTEALTLFRGVIDRVPPEQRRTISKAIAQLEARN